jgi:PAS domain S-box-containing protein
VEQQLLAKTALLEAQVNSALDGILIVDPEGKIILQNQRFQDLWGLPDDLETIGVNSRLEWVLQQVGNPKEYSSRIDYLYAHPEMISRDDIELQDGRSFERDSAPVLGAAGEYYGRIWIFRDVTERRRALEQIAEQAALLDKARDAIMVRDFSGTLLYWNNGAENVYGWTREEVIGRNIGDVLLDEPQRLIDVNKALMSHGEWTGEVKHQTRHRGEITVEARWTLIRDEQGRPKSVLAINTDVTEKKKIEAQFMRAQRLESLGTLAGGVAHDLNNILAPIMMAVEVLKDISRDPRAAEILDTLAVSAARGADIVRQVLSFARGMDGQRVEVQAGHLLKDIASIIRDTFPKNIRLEFSAAPDMWTVLGDPTQLHQILLNLCVNARDAMPDGGRLTVSACNCEVDPQYAAMDPQAKAGPYVMISVADTGMGIPRAIIDKIFEPFFTTKDVSKGTGLGLSTVMAIAKSHGGFISVTSEPGMGSIFKVYLPTARLSPAALDQVLAPVLRRGNGETILVVDDEASIRTITRGTLEAYGYVVLTAGDGVEAVAQFATHREQIDAVLVDMMMPLMDGPTTIHALMRMAPGVKIIASSGVSDGPGLAKAADAGVKRILAKPYTAASLLDTVAALLSEP